MIINDLFSLSNKMCNTAVLHVHKLNKMEDSYQRLLQAARELRKLDNPADVARLLHISDQTIQNWKTRGVPKGKLVEIEEKIGAQPKWIVTGKGEMTKPRERLGESNLTKEQKEILSLLARLDKDARDSWIRIGGQLLRIPHQSPKKPREDQGVTDEQGLVKSAAKKIRVPGYSGHDRRKANAGHSPERRLDSNTYSDEHDLLDYDNDNREEQIQKRGEIDD